MSNHRWRLQSLCADPQHADVDFLSTSKVQIRKAKAICEQCPVIDECRADAHDMVNRQKLRVDGVRGGESYHDRKQLEFGRSNSHRIAFVDHGTTDGYTWHTRTGIPACAACQQAHNEQAKIAKARRRAAHRALAPV